MYLMEIFMIRAPHHMLFLFIKFRMMRGGKRVAHKRGEERNIKRVGWET